MSLRAHCAVAAALAVVAVCAFAQEEQKAAEFAKVCGVDISRTPDGVFAKQRKSWSRFADAKSVPEMDEQSGAVAQYWRTAHASFVQLVNYGDGYARYHEYCFGPDGKLSRLGFEARTIRGWGFAQTSTVTTKGQLEPIAARYFDLRSQRTINPPDAVKDEPWIVNADIYRRFDKLPFAKLVASAKPEKKADARSH